MIIPEFLKSGDKIGIVATAKKIDKNYALGGISVLKSWGLKPKPGKYLFNSHNQFAGTDDQRKEDLQAMINDHEIKAIFMARGGYGSTRIIDEINFKSLLTNPKWICGFSDITAFQLHLYNLGIASFHSPMPSFFHSTTDESISWMKQMLFGKINNLIVPPNVLNRNGSGRGRLVGGNLSIICHTIGTSSEIKTDGNILFLEDVGEQLYHLDRMMVQLKRAGFLDDLTGLIVGQFSEMEDDSDSFGLSAEEIIRSHITAFNYPVAFNFPIGHTNHNYTIPVGIMCELTVDEKGASLSLNC